MATKKRKALGAGGNQGGQGKQTQSLASDYILPASACQSPNYAKAADEMEALAFFHLEKSLPRTPRCSYHFERFMNLLDYEANLRVLAAWQGVAR